MKIKLSFGVVLFSLLFVLGVNNMSAKEEELRGSNSGNEDISLIKFEDKSVSNINDDSLDDELDKLDDLEDDLDDIDDALELESEDDSDNKGRGEEHRSEVADFVEKLLDVADHNGKLGEEIRKIASEQASSTDDVAERINKIENRSRITIFLIGTDYKNLGALRSEIVKTEARLEALKREAEKLIPLEKAIIEAEISNLENEQDKLESFIEDNEDRFSLFGWVSKLLD